MLFSVASAKAQPLFESDEVLDVILTAPFDTIMDDRTEDEQHPGSLTFPDAAGAMQELLNRLDHAADPLRDLAGRARDLDLTVALATNGTLVDQTIATDTPGSIVEAKKSGRLADPEKMIDAIEKGVRKNKDIIYPQEARFLYLWRALLPKLWWKVVMNFEK